MSASFIRGILVAFPLFLAACVGPNPRLAPVLAEPNTRPARNFTSFAPALDCMDRLLKSSKRGQTLISSTDIPDETARISVGADDMLINALSRMNATSQRYVFVDQSLIKFGGLLDVEVQNGDELVPQYYIRGSISQLDQEVANDSADITATPSGGGLTGSRFGPYRKLSVVSVDMHLVAFPSRRVVPGASVANSMVVVGQGFGASASGLIDMATLGISLQIRRVESESQAVRNLVELGLIELLGRHAGVPYWTCLALPDTNAKVSEKTEKGYVRRTQPVPLSEVQSMLATLGYLDAPFETTLGQRTRSAISRFQADERVLPNGILDFDLVDRLKRKVEGQMQLDPNPRASVLRTKPTAKPKPVAAPAVRPTTTPNPKTVSDTRAPTVPTEDRGVSCPTSSPGNPCDDSYINLYDFLNTQ